MRKVPSERLLDLLSEALAMEGDNLQLYHLAWERSRSQSVRTRLKQVAKDVQAGVDRLETLIRDLGGNPVYVSPGAEIQIRRAQYWMEFEVENHHQESVDFENLFLAEMRAQAGEIFLRAVLPSVEDVHVREAVGRYLEQFQGEKQARRDWVREVLFRLWAQLLTSEKGPSRRAA
ncbi:MAG: hypothetical protein ACXVBW_10030 [Bdellovibrionota bacterium]